MRGPALAGLAACARERASFLKEETPAFQDYRVTVIETPAAAR